MTSILRSRAEAELESYAFDPSCLLFMPFYRLEEGVVSQDALGIPFVKTGDPYWTPRGWFFDGGDDKLRAADLDVHKVKGGTLEAWAVVHAEEAANHGAILGHYICGSGAEGFSLGPSSGEWKLLMYGEIANDSVGTGVAVENEVMNHIVGTYEYAGTTGTKRVYLDGQMIQERTGNYGNLKYTIPDWGMAFGGSMGSGTVKCTILLGILYSRALTPQEVSRHAIIMKETFG